MTALLIIDWIDWSWLEVGERYLLVPGEASPPIWPWFVLGGLVTTLVLTRKRWTAWLRHKWMRWRGPRLTGAELARLEATEIALAELLAVVEKPKRVRRELDEPMVAYRKALHRHAQLRKYLSLHTDDLEDTIDALHEQKALNGTGVPKRRVEAALAATETRVRARARALDELDALELELVHLESMMWATVENRITRSKSNEREEVRDLLARIKANEDARVEIDRI